MSNSDLYRLPDGRTKLKAHDVRHLHTCKACGSMADDREVILEMHPKCFFGQFGRQAVLDLSIEDRNKFALGDIPVSLMKELIGAK